MLARQTEGEVGWKSTQAGLYILYCVYVTKSGRMEVRETGKWKEAAPLHAEHVASIRNRPPCANTSFTNSRT
jgi:hypothetical protein